MDKKESFEPKHGQSTEWGSTFDVREEALRDAIPVTEPVETGSPYIFSFMTKCPNRSKDLVTEL